MSDKLYHAASSLYNAGHWITEDLNHAEQVLLWEALKDALESYADKLMLGEEKEYEQAP